MRRSAVGRNCSRLALMVVAAMVAAGPLGADAQDSILIDLPSSGRLREVAQHLATELESRGLELVELAGNVLPEPPPTSIVTADDAVRDPQWRESLEQFIRAGGGMVLIVGRSQRHIEQANTFTQPLGIETLYDPRVAGPVEFWRSALTSGLAPPEVGSLRTGLRADRIVAIARQSEQVICGGVVVDGGGLIILPDQLVLADIDQPPERRSGLSLLARSAVWASRLSELRATALPGGGQLPSPIDIPGGQTDLPLERRDFAGAILYDCQAAEDDWPVITGVVVRALEESGLPVKALRVQDAQQPLVEALPSRPELVVLGSWREYGVAECAAIYQYVASGGSLLALAHAHTDRQIRLVYLNEPLIQFGVVCSLGRSGGAAEVVGGPLEQLGEIPGGVRLLGEAVQPLITVREGRQLAAGYVEFERGRVMALDAGPLLASAVYRLQLKERVVPWLVRSE